eukprot:TRINITY_DN3127_c0_g1_i2.p1 TRINITY_DN3127_c0_g1~~TRINITY_DN3127_c0_g1_i2.p1  ORF type:complete len:285 (+),score=61.26 TRINITY_DN3127_c0_g1_i2:222-1076(+)
MSSGQLFLDGKSTVTTKVHPVVLFSILDHHSRRGQNVERVIGTLLGSVSSEGVVEIHASFPVPHTEFDEQVAVDMEFHKQMFDLHTRVSPKDVIVGWYATGSEVTEHSLLLHEFYAREVSNPVHLLVDTSLQNDKLATKAFVSSNTAVGAQFEEVALEFKSGESERIGVDAMISSQNEAALPTGQSALTDVDNLERSIQKLLNLLDGIGEYVDSVIGGQTQGSVEIGRALTDALQAVPHVDARIFDRMLNHSLQDLLVVLYLSSLTRTQIAITHKMNTLLVNNK